MKKTIISLFMIISMVIITIVSACAEGWDSNWGLGGGMKSLFSSEDDSTTYKPGEKVSVGDYEVTLTNIMQSKGSSYNKPESGNEFLIVEYSIKNNSKEDLSVSSLMSFSAVVDDISYSLSLSADSVALLSGYMQFDMTIEPGKTGTGIVGYELPINWKVGKFSVKPDFFGSDKVTYLVER